MTAKIPDEFVSPSGHTVEIGKDTRGYWVRCWDEEDNMSWEVRGVVTSDDGSRQTRRPYTEEEALAEFNKWRN